MLLDGIQFDGAAPLFLAALLLGVVNAFVRPVVVLLTIPITLITLGLFMLVINGAMIALVAWMMPAFHVAGLGAAIVASIIVGVTSWAATSYVGDRGKIQTVNSKGRKS
jgi:putative membrane protein